MSNRKPEVVKTGKSDKLDLDGAAAFDRGLATPSPSPVLQWPHEGFWPFDVYYAEFLRVKTHLQAFLNERSSASVKEHAFVANDPPSEEAK